MSRIFGFALGVLLVPAVAVAQPSNAPPIDLSKIPTGTSTRPEIKYGTLILIPSGKQSSAVEEANKKLVIEWFDDFWNKGNFANWPRYMTADFRNHDPIEPAVGAQALVDWLNDRLKETGRPKPLPKPLPSKLFVVAEGDLVFVAHMGRIPTDPTKDPAAKFGGNLLRVTNGKISEWWYTGPIAGMGGDTQGGTPSTPPAAPPAGG